MLFKEIQSMQWSTVRGILMVSSTTVSLNRVALFTHAAPCHAARRLVLTLALCLVWLLSVQSARAAAAYIQGNSTTTASATSSIATTFSSAQLSGDLNIVVVEWQQGVTVSSITDQSGNTYQLALGPSLDGGSGGQSIYYAANIKAAAAGANTVTVTFSASSTNGGGLRAVEYSGIVTVNPLDVAEPRSVPPRVMFVAAATSRPRTRPICWSESMSSTPQGPARGTPSGSTRRLTI
jgi:hypothetical protein